MYNGEKRKEFVHPFPSSRHFVSFRVQFNPNFTFDSDPVIIESDSSRVRTDIRVNYPIHRAWQICVIREFPT